MFPELVKGIWKNYTNEKPKMRGKMDMHGKEGSRTSFFYLLRDSNK